jgi:hypothetical protein
MSFPLFERVGITVQPASPAHANPQGAHTLNAEMAKISFRHAILRDNSMKLFGRSDGKGVPCTVHSNFPPECP